MEFPSFDKLPRVEGRAQGCLWGFFDKDGKKDEVGTLNLLTPAVVLRAKEEIKTGQHVQLDWPLDSIKPQAPWRRDFQHKVINLKDFGHTGFDDEVAFNTQHSSQWDSLKHFSKSGMFYNGLTAEAAASTPTNGTHNWVERGGIVGRGVLVDWLRWYENKHGKAPHYSPQKAIPVSEIEEALKFQGTTLVPGDIFILRTGFVRWHNVTDPALKQKEFYNVGVEGEESTIRWLYDRHFAAVVSDNASFEVWPPNERCCLHEWLLVQWGTPIGEMWDLEKLSVVCEQQKRWTFFLTSAPLHVRGGVASPPGAIAVF